VRGFLSGTGPTALFDLPWLPVYLGICFLFHTYIGLTAVGGAIILVALTLLTEMLTRRPTRSRGGGDEEDQARDRHAPRSSLQCATR
jgi:ATP-binding cassette, subfamily C, bacterial